MATKIAPAPAGTDESEVQRLGAELLRELRRARGGLSIDRAADALMEWAMSDPGLRVGLFRFVEVLPSLATPADTLLHAREYLHGAGGQLGGAVKAALSVDPHSFLARGAAATVRTQIRRMAQRFVAGETVDEAAGRLRDILASGRTWTVDLLGEASLSDDEARASVDAYVALVGDLAAAFPRHVGDAPGRIEVSVKLSSLVARMQPVAAAHAEELLLGRLRRVAEAARDRGIGLTVDMEDSRWTSLTLAVVRRLALDPDFRRWDGFGCVLQAYLRRTEGDLDAMLAWLADRPAPLGVRLVKGAYWDQEVIHARQERWPVPVFTQRAATDLCYETLTRKLLDAGDRVRPAFATHNVRSVAVALAEAEARGRLPAGVEFQALHGMADELKEVLAARGLRVREYMPLGELLPGMAYLVRRLLENTSQQGFVRHERYEQADTSRLLAKPEVTPRRRALDAPAPDLKAKEAAPFANAPFTDWSRPESRDAMAAALATAARGRTPRLGPVVAGEVRPGGGGTVAVRPPDAPDTVIAEIGWADAALAGEAATVAAESFRDWASTGATARAAILRRAADLLDERRHAVAATVVREVAKPWAEADAEVAEAIDFLRYYAEGAEALALPQPTERLPGETNVVLHEPRGTTLVLGPWNFPLAIPMGMAAAALATGNPVLLKPAEQASLTGHLVASLLWEAGVPGRVLAWLPGRGEEVGAALATHPAVATIAFTGSEAVGRELFRRAAETLPGQEHLRRVIAEMGGKNAIVVDADADLDQAVAGVLASAFGYAGQKCSAASRVFVVESVLGRFLDRLGAATACLRVGRAVDPATEVPAVIEESSRARLLTAIEATVARGARRVGASPGLPAGPGWWVPPTVLADCAPDDPLLRDELFGPVVAVVAVADFEEGVRRAVDTPYGLTGGVYSRRPGHLELATREFRVGNLYLNRPCTGALVRRQPFGGARRSGVGAKAGGPDYLKQFTWPRVVTENTLRSGFSPELDELGEALDS